MDEAQFSHISHLEWDDRAFILCKKSLQRGPQKQEGEHLQIDPNPSHTKLCEPSTGKERTSWTESLRIRDAPETD